jgi:predicted transcriptional regulator
MQATTMRLKPELIESLKVEAKKDDRSLNNLINKVLGDFVKGSSGIDEGIKRNDENLKACFK